MNTIERTLSEKLNGIPSFLVAFSGGADSLALLASLSAVGKRAVALYVDHGLREREELEREIALNEANCRLLGFPLVVRRLDSVLLRSRAREEGTEQAARLFRYRVLFEECRKRNLPLLTAHTLDDQMETVIMRLFQGGSPYALTMEERSEREGVTILRPLLSLTHRSLKDYLLSRGLSWSEDSTNEDDTHLRNSIRHTIVPSVLSVFPGGKSAIARLASRSSGLSKAVRSLAATVPLEEGKLERETFLSLPPFLRDEVLYRLLSDGESRLSSRLVSSLRDALERGAPRRVEWGTMTCAVRDDCLIVVRGERGPSFVISLESAMKGDLSLTLPDGSLFRVRAESDDGTLLRIGGRLEKPILRSAMRGDVIVLSGGSVSLSSLFASWKIPPPQRSSIPILEERGGIVAVFARSWGGRDRLALKYKSLAPRQANVYSVTRRNQA